MLNVVKRGHISLLAYNRFWWRRYRIFNALPPAVRNMSKCGVNVFKRKLDNFLSQVPVDPCETNSDNSIAGAALRQSWCLQRDGLTINSLNSSSKYFANEKIF